MAQKKKIAYWLLLITVLYLAGSVMSVGESQARYVNTATWYTVAEPTQNNPTSDCLEPVTQPPITVLLGQMDQESREISFTLDSRTDTSGMLAWRVDSPDYLDVRVQIGDTSLSSGDTVSLTGETPVTVTMLLSLTEKALEPRDGMNVNIQVSFGETLTGTFRVELMPVDGQILAATEQEATEPEVTEPEVTEPEVTEPEVTEPEATEPEVTEPEVTEPEVTEPEATEPEVTVPPAAIVLESAQTYHSACLIPLKVVSDGDTKTSLQLVSGESVLDFPRGTRFSLDKGASWFMLYQAGALQLDVTAGTPLTVLLDLSHTALVTEPSLTVTAGTGEAITLTVNTAPLYTANTQVLNKNTELVVTLAELWQNCQLVYSVEVLLATEESKYYVPVVLSEDGLMAELSGQKLRIRTGDILPPAGTYRLNLRWMDQGICVGQTQLSFFINYAAKQNVTQAGGAQ